MSQIVLSRRQMLGQCGGLLATGLGLGAAPSLATAQSYPNKPIRIINGTPGGLADVLARAFGEMLTEQLGQAVAVEPRAGGGGVVALQAIASAPADGYTLGFANVSALWQNRVLYKKLPYDPDLDFAPISLWSGGNLIMAVPTSLPVNNVKEFLAWCKANPNNSSIGTYGPGSVPHMVTDALNLEAGLNIPAVHYRSPPNMWTDVGSGIVKAGLAGYQSFEPLRQAGLIKPIGVIGGRHRSPRLPDVPTLAEQGLKDPLFSLDTSLVLLAPGKTPEPILQTLAAVATKGGDSPRGVKLRDQLSIPNQNKPTSLAETRRRWKEEAPVWIDRARKLGITLD